MSAPKKRPKGWPRRHYVGCPRRVCGNETALIDNPACTCGVLEIRRAMKVSK